MIRPLILQFGRLVVVVVVVVAKEEKEEKDTQNTQKKKKQRMKTDKNAHYWPFLALFQGKELCFVLCDKYFLIRPLPFGLNSCMTQQNKGSYQKFFNT